MNQVYIFFYLKNDIKEEKSYGITRAPKMAMASPVAHWPLSLGMNMPFITHLRLEASHNSFLQGNNQPL